MKPINTTIELASQLRRLSLIAREVAYAKNETEAEYFTIHYLRPAVQEAEKTLEKVNCQKKIISSIKPS